MLCVLFFQYKTLRLAEADKIANLAQHPNVWGSLSYINGCRIESSACASNLHKHGTNKHLRYNKFQNSYKTSRHMCDPFAGTFHGNSNQRIHLNHLPATGSGEFQHKRFQQRLAQRRKADWFRYRELARPTRDIISDRAKYMTTKVIFHNSGTLSQLKHQSGSKRRRIVSYQGHKRKTVTWRNCQSSSYYVTNSHRFHKEKRSASQLSQRTRFLTAERAPSSNDNHLC